MQGCPFGNTTCAHYNQARPSSQLHHVSCQRLEKIFHSEQWVANMTLGHSTPSCPAIMNAPMEPKIKSPTIADAYGGTTDLDTHLLAYCHHIYVKEPTRLWRGANNSRPHWRVWHPNGLTDCWLKVLALFPSLNYYCLPVSWPIKKKRRWACF